MKKIFVLIALYQLIVLSCSSMITLTGIRRQSLPKDAEVKIYNIILPEKYEEVGYMVIKDNNIEYRFNEAKKIARKYGCNGILPKEEEKKTRTWKDVEYTIDLGKPSMTYKTMHEEWVEQGFIIIYVH